MSFVKKTGSGWARRLAVGALSLSLSWLVATTASWAQTFPSKPVRVIVPYSAGTATDVLTRVVTIALAERIKQPVLIENRLGAGGIVGLTALKNAAPDGYTLGIIVSANAVQPSLMKDLPFDIRKDFMPMSLTYSGPLVLTVPASFPAQTLGEFIAHAKANPGKIFYGSVGTGSTAHMAGELLKQAAGFDMSVVPYKGTPEVYAAMLGGSVQAGFDNYLVPKPLIDAGKLRLLGVASRQRWPRLPQVPTIAESFPGFEVVFWTGFAAPLGTPREPFEKMASDLRAVMNNPEVRQRITDTGVDAGGNSPAEFNQMIIAEVEKWAKVVKSAGMKQE